MVFQRYFLKVIIFIFSCVCWAVSSSQSQADTFCKRVISNLTELAQAGTENAVFGNFTNHDFAFQIYRTQFLGRIGREDTEKRLTDVLDITNQHPELHKPSVREKILTLEQRNYEYPESLRDFVQGFKSLADQFKAQLFQPEQGVNLDFWQRLLMPLKKEELTGLSKQEKKAKQKEHQAQFMEYFNRVLTPKDLEFLENISVPTSMITDNSYRDTIAVYRIFDRIRNQMIEEGKNVENISQVMVDLVHTIGGRNPYDSSHFGNSRDQQLQVDLIILKSMLKRRDDIARHLNFSDFSEMTRFLNVDHPTGFANRKNWQFILSDIQKDIQNSPYTVAGQQVLRVRALSLQESPFRGCLGGDCSTEEYFDLALDPNFIYFTLTDAKFKSSGYIAVVLGTAYSGQKKKHVKIAFVDKIEIMNPTVTLPMLEAIRLSLAEMGYRLGLPVYVGFDDGLSSKDFIRSNVVEEIHPFLTRHLIDFKPHETPYNFWRGDSRAYSSLELLEFERWEGDFTIEDGKIHTESMVSEVNIENVLKEIYSP